MLLLIQDNRLHFFISLLHDTRSLKMIYYGSKPLYPSIRNVTDLGFTLFEIPRFLVIFQEEVDYELSIAEIDKSISCISFLGKINWQIKKVEVVLMVFIQSLQKIHLVDV